jgi:hypothetical protein
MVLSKVLSQAAHRRLRSELAISYGAAASLNAINNLHHGAKDTWAHLLVSSSMNGVDVITGLEAIYDDVLYKDLSEQIVTRALINIKRGLDQVLESDPSGIANLANDTLSAAPVSHIDLEESSTLADAITVESINALRKEVIDVSPLVIASSPSQDVLDDIAEWVDHRS